MQRLGMAALLFIGARGATGFPSEHQPLTPDLFQESAYSCEEAGTPLMATIETDDLRVKPKGFESGEVSLQLWTGVKDILLAAPEEHGRQDQGMHLNIPGKVTPQNNEAVAWPATGCSAPSHGGTLGEARKNNPAVAPIRPQFRHDMPHVGDVILYGMISVQARHPGAHHLPGLRAVEGMESLDCHQGPVSGPRNAAKGIQQVLRPLAVAMKTHQKRSIRLGGGFHQVAACRGRGKKVSFDHDL